MSAVLEKQSVDKEELLERTRELAPKLRERRADAKEARVLPEETIAEMQEAGLFRVLQPARWGGYEMDPQTFFDIEIELGRACPSTAWVYGVVAVHAWQLALFDERAQEEVWGDDDSTLISSSYMPVGKVEHVEGGFMLSGRWGFSSGSDHCDWAFLGGFVPPKEEGQSPDMRTFLVPKGDYELDDTWFTSGLEATGSKDVVIDEPVFVPAYRTHRFSDGFKLDSPGNEQNDAPLYKIPFGQLFVRSVSTSSIGMLEGAIDAFVETQKERVARGDGRKVTDDPALQKALAEAQATARDLRLVLKSNFEDLMEYAENDEFIPIDLRVAYRYDSARVVEQCQEAVLELFRAAGGGASFSTHNLQPYMQALLVARQHHANNPEKPGMNYGRVTLGMKTTDFFL
jgi:3-hydroxy-9,10-secoandrosta-1,3,5(10)-triene-9,17-dione monooxygenase